MNGPALLVIDCKTNRMLRYFGRTRTHKEFGVNAALNGEPDVLLFLEFARTDPDSQGIDREAVHVN